MKTSGNTILITGGATGIGFALAEAFVKAGNEVIICGRRESKLEEAKKKLPQLHTLICDVELPAERVKLFKQSTSQFGKLNILINNAGIQKAHNFNNADGDMFADENEITINLEAPIHLCALFMEHLKKQASPAIMNVSSGLGFVPLTFLPVYCATKAGLHSFTKSLRHQLKISNIKVFEIIPPTVDSELDRGRRGNSYRGVPATDVSDATMIGIEKDEYEITVGESHKFVDAVRNATEQAFQNMNSRH
ncbi:MAG: SDR family NAD(P)-dependent oxidoreductase [FCB group bacterium]|jgi:uncharacterized oxidoreductase